MSLSMPALSIVGNGGAPLTPAQNVALPHVHASLPYPPLQPAASAAAPQPHPPMFEFDAVKAWMAHGGVCVGMPRLQRLPRPNLQLLVVCRTRYCAKRRLPTVRVSS